MNYDRILVRMPNWIGDVVMATPALRAIRRRWPGAKITAMCLPSGEQVLSGNSAIDAFEVYRRSGPDGGLFGRGRTIRRLRKGEYDLGILLPNSFSSAWLLKRARIPVRLGTAYGGRGWLLTEKFQPAMEDGRRVPRSMVEHYFDLLETIGVPRGDPKTELFETDRGRRAAEKVLRFLGIREGDPVLVVSPGASFGPSKQWYAERYAAVADHLQRKYGLKPLLVGGPGEEHLLDAIEARMETKAYSTAHELLDLEALKTAVRRSSLMIATDAGPRHYAVAFGVPVVVLMGPTDPRYSESNLERTIVLREELDCSPCHQKTCPLTHHRCMDFLTADRAIAAAEDLMARHPPPPRSPDPDPEPEDEPEDDEEPEEDGQEGGPPPNFLQNQPF